MGNNYVGQEDGVEELRKLSGSARLFLSHHLNNSLQSILWGAELGRLDIVREAVKHILGDLELIGVR